MVSQLIFLKVLSIIISIRLLERFVPPLKISSSISPRAALNNNLFSQLDLSPSDDASR